MIINHNLPAMNSYRQMGINAANSSKSTEKLSSGLRINRAGDDAAGLAISEKMRAQIRGLDQASRNSQDGISMIQTAEGALGETHSILQRMRELATQAANDTNVAVDRGEIQKEMNQLSSEINRIGNTTEFNTQSLLKGDGKTNLTGTGLIQAETALSGGVEAVYTQASSTFTVSGGGGTSGFTNSGTFTWTVAGQTLTFTVASGGANGQNSGSIYNVTGNSATINVTAGLTADEAATSIRDALKQVIAANGILAGQFDVTGSSKAVTVSAKADGNFKGVAGGIIATNLDTNAVASGGAEAATTGASTAAVQASGGVLLSGIDTVAKLNALVGQGMTLGGQQVEFYNANNGAYKGNAIGINLSDVILGNSGGSGLAKAIIAQAGPQLKDITISQSGNDLRIQATAGGTAGNNIKISDGGKQEAFQATFQVGANTGQSMTIDVNDMRSMALGVTAAAGKAGFASVSNVTDGTSSTLKEAALDVSSSTGASAAIKVINNAIEKVSAERSKLGAFQNRLEHTINNLNTSSENLTASESRIRDTDMAKTVMENSKNNILSQAAQAMLAQANQNPQQVLQLLR